MVELGQSQERSRETSSRYSSEERKSGQSKSRRRIFQGSVRFKVEGPRRGEPKTRGFRLYQEDKLFEEAASLLHQYDLYAPHPYLYDDMDSEPELVQQK